MEQTQKRQVTVQLVRSAVQVVMSQIVYRFVGADLLDGFGIDDTEFYTAVEVALSGVFLVAYIALVNVLEQRVDPRFGWLNGWRAQVNYQPPPQVR